MNKTKIRRLRHHQRQKEIQDQKLQKELQEKKEFLLLRRKKLRQESKDRSAAFFNERDERWKQRQRQDNLAVPSIFTTEGGKCTKKRSPLEL